MHPFAALRQKGRAIGASRECVGLPNESEWHRGVHPSHGRTVCFEAFFLFGARRYRNLYFNIQEKDVANRNGGERSVTLNTNLSAVLSDAEITVSYPDPDNSDFVSDIRIEGNTLKYILAENSTGETRNATIALEYTDKAGVTTTTNPCLNIEQNLFSGSFADIEFTTANELHPYGLSKLSISDPY